jgi:hypothetical protein
MTCPALLRPLPHHAARGVARRMAHRLLPGPGRGLQYRVDLDFWSFWDLRHARPPSLVV